jgi:hypothetical protein
MGAGENTMQNVKPQMRSVLLIAAPLGAGLTALGETSAVRARGNDDRNTPTWAKGKVWDSHLQLLDALKDPDAAKGPDDRGCATRKLGHSGEGIAFYLKSAALDPRYAEVREYPGEAYVIEGRLDLACDQLDTIKTLCGTVCEEYRDLSEAFDHPSKS